MCHTQEQTVERLFSHWLVAFAQDQVLRRLVVQTSIGVGIVFKIWCPLLEEYEAVETFKLVGIELFMPLERIYSCP